MSEDCICICRHNPVECRSKNCICTCIFKKNSENCRAKDHVCSCKIDTDTCRTESHNCACKYINIDDKINNCKSLNHYDCICKINIILCKGINGGRKNLSHHFCNCDNGICKSDKHNCICYKKPWSCKENSHHDCSCKIVGLEHCKAIMIDHLVFFEEEEVKEKKKKKKSFFKMLMGM